MQLLVFLLFAACGVSAKDIARSNIRLDLAKDFVAKHDLENAETEANRAIALHARNEEAFLVRGLAKLLRAYDAKRIVEIDNCLTGLDAEATERDVTQFLRQADKDFASAAALASDYSEALANRAVIANLEQRPSAAIGFLQAALENPVRLANPGLARAHLGWAYFLLDDMVAAAKELRTALQFQPGMCVATYRLGRVYFERQEMEKAAETFQSVADAPECASQEARYYLMVARRKLGHVDQARSARAACLALSPKSCIAQRCQSEGAGL